ncbi:MAG: nuclear transport factor 2 family protein [Clostridia bacterium]
MRGVVENIYARFMQGDFAPLFDALDPNVEWTVHAAHRALGGSGQYHGPDGVRHWFETLGENLHLTAFAPDAWFVDGDALVVLGHEHSRVVSTGGASASRWAHVWMFRDGRVVAFEEIASATEADAGP